MLAMVLGGAIAVAEDTYCNNLGGSSGCGSWTQCKHSATVVCLNLVATVTYSTTCRDGSGGVATETKVQNVLKTSTDSVTNNCGCTLVPSLGRTWGAICDEGDCCECFDLTCF